MKIDRPWPKRLRYFLKRIGQQTAIFPVNPFERRLRDAYSASQQIQGRPANFITIGRVFLGLPPDSMVVLG